MSKCESDAPKFRPGLYVQAAMKCSNANTDNTKQLLDNGNVSFFLS